MIAIYTRHSRLRKCILAPQALSGIRNLLGGFQKEPICGIVKDPDSEIIIGGGKNIVKELCCPATVEMKSEMKEITKGVFLLNNINSTPTVDKLKEYFSYKHT
jgi:hypothetical protein